MGVAYYRRFRMEIEVSGRPLPEPELPEGYRLHAWDPDCLERHARAKYVSFRDEIDSRVFQCLGEYDGCCRLMEEISGQKGFLPDATWLISRDGPDDVDPADCGTIQGLAHSRSLGAVQNVGVVPDHRGLGLGRALMLSSLIGFRSAGLKRVYLEVTAENHPAVQLYRSIGFRLVRTMYKAVDVEPSRT